jgi:hypothetical protein
MVIVKRRSLPRGFQPLPIVPRDLPEEDSVCPFYRGCENYVGPFGDFEEALNEEAFEGSHSTCYGLDSNERLRIESCVDYQKEVKARERMQREFPDVVFLDSNRMQQRLFTRGSRVLTDRDVQDAFDEGHNSFDVMQTFAAPSMDSSGRSVYHPEKITGSYMTLVGLD